MHWLQVVKGTITSLDVLLNSVTILRLWGPAVYVRCLRAIASGRSCTFLEVLVAEPPGRHGAVDGDPSVWHSP